MLRISTALLATLFLSACDEPTAEISEAATTQRQPFDLKQNLPAIYERAVKDFAEYEMTHRNPESPRRTFRLDNGADSLIVYGDDDWSMVDFPPEMFRRVDSATALGDHLLNADEEFPVRPDNPVRTITVRSLGFSEARRRVQIALGWTDTIGESWTFLYEIADNGSLRLLKSIMLGCSTPEGWIDGQF